MELNSAGWLAEMSVLRRVACSVERMGELWDYLKVVQKFVE
jgi:hypothetical protein